MPKALHDAEIGTSGITCSRKYCCTSFHLSWPRKCNGTIDDTVVSMWCLSQWCHITKRDMLHILSFHLSLTKETKVLFMMLLASCDTDPNGIIWHQHHWYLMMPVGIVYHDQKSHFISNFDYLDLKNIMVTLGMLTASCDANTSVSGMAWEEKSCCTSFLSYQQKECNDAIGTSSDTETGMKSITWPNVSFCTLHWSSRHKECNGTIDNVISIMWSGHWCQWCHMTKKVWCT